MSKIVLFWLIFMTWIVRIRISKIGPIIYENHFVIRNFALLIVDIKSMKIRIIVLWKYTLLLQFLIRSKSHCELSVKDIISKVMKHHNDHHLELDSMHSLTALPSFQNWQFKFAIFYKKFLNSRQNSKVEQTKCKKIKFMTIIRGKIPGFGEKLYPNEQASQYPIRTIESGQNLDRCPAFLSENYSHGVQLILPQMKEKSAVTGRRFGLLTLNYTKSRLICT